MRAICLAWLIVPFVVACSAAGGDEGGIAGGGGHTVGSGGSAGGGSGGDGGGISIGGSTSSGGSSTGGGGLGGVGGVTSGGASGQGASGGCQSSGNNGWAAAGGGGPETCSNGVDDDLNGFVDEGCVCALGTTQSCYGGPPGLAGKGACVKGTQTCSGNEFGNWGPCKGWVAPSIEVCEGAVDENCDGQIDESCGCCEGATQSCGVQQGACTPGSQSCVGGKWGECTGGTMPTPEICGNSIDEDCDGQVDDGCTLTVPVNIDGDCVTASCPPQAPYPVGCNIVMSGGDSRGCIANNGGPIVYFQEGDKCGAGHVGGTLLCSSQPGAPLGPANCAINKSTKYYPSSKSGCPSTS